MKIPYLTSVLFSFFTLFLSFAFAQNPGDVDPSFDTSDGADQLIFETIVQPDGKILIGGTLTTYAGVARNSIARVNEDGSLDTSFDPGYGAEGTVHALALQPDGKILVGGLFFNYDSTGLDFIVRINADGSLDNSFNPGTGTGSSVFSIAVQADGKILIGGTFTSYNGTPRSRIARLNADGTLDTSFDPGTGTNEGVIKIRIQPDGKIIIVGSFIEYNGITRNRVARLNSDGSLDPSFDPGSGSTVNVVTVDLQSDGKILVGGKFNSFNGTTVGHIARLNTDGSIDPSFDQGDGADDDVESIVVLSDDKILIGGDFIFTDGLLNRHIARLNADGSPDISFITGNVGAQNTVYAIALQPDNKIVIGGVFNSYQGQSSQRLARLYGEFVSGISEHAKERFHIAPNPADQELNLSYSGKAEFIVVQNMSGGQVLKEMYSNKLNVSSLRSGVYFISLTDRQGATLITQRFVKK